LERAAGIEPESEQGTSEETAESTEPAPVPRSVDADPPEWASRQLAESWERAREAMREWRESASDPASDPHRTAQLQQEAQRRQMEALSLARQERSWQTSRSEEERAQEQRLREQWRSDSETSADRLERSVERLDRALERLHRSDDSPGLPPPEVGEALTRAAERLGEQTPQTAREMSRAAQARERGEGEQMDHALEQARRALQREAGAEAQRFSDARRRLNELHDEVARRAAERGEGQPQLAQNGLPGQEGQQQNGQAGQQGQQQGAQGQ